MNVPENKNIRASGNLHSSVRQSYAMYARRLMTEIYHLVQPGGQHTVCGLRISRITSERKANTLQLVSEAPLKLQICKHCERIKNQEIR